MTNRIRIRQFACAFGAALLPPAGCSGGPAVNARDRIGAGPWFNQQGTEIAASLDVLHSARDAHISDGCSPRALHATGGAGLFYCFAID